jgi:hypothetical protein
MAVMHINNTGRPIRYRTWMTRASLVTSNHFVVLKSHNIPARYLLDSDILRASNGSHYRYSNSDPRAEFETTCDEQDVVLQLLYGKDLILLMEEVVLPNTYSVCTLSTMNI